MAASSVHREPPVAETKALVKLWTDWFAIARDAQLGEGLIAVRETGIDSLEAVFAEGLRRFDKSGEYPTREKWHPTCQNRIQKVVGREGLEPSTNRL